MEGRKFGNVPVTIELKLSVEDSPNSAGVIIDAVRDEISVRQRTAGVLLSPSAYEASMGNHRHKAREMVEEFIQTKRER